MYTVGIEVSVADPGDPKKTGSGSYLDMFLMFSILFWHFCTIPRHLMTLNIKDKKYLAETVFWTILFNEKI